MDPTQLPKTKINWKPEGKNEAARKELGKMGYIQP